MSDTDTNAVPPVENATVKTVDEPVLEPITAETAPVLEKDAEKPTDNVDEKKRTADTESDAKKKKRRRRQYDDAPKDEPESADDDDNVVDEAEDNADEDEEEDLAEIDVSNIITTGRRTRGKVIDFAKAAKENDIPEDDEDEDGEFEEPKEEAA